MIPIDFFKPQEKTEELTLEIEPVSCISVADKINSSFIDCSKIVSDNKIYGILENVMDFKFDTKLREEIKKLTLGIKPKDIETATPDHKSRLRYFPVIDDICDIIFKPDLKIKSFFIDFASTLYSDYDKRHLSGSRICDSEIQNLSPTERIAIIDLFDPSKTNASDLTEEQRVEKQRLLQLFPQFYTGTSKRKYVFIDPFQIKLKTTKDFSDRFKEKIIVNCRAYLGNSESIVNLNLI